jgi:starch synthase
MGRDSGLRVLVVTPELAPWMKSGGLGEVSATLPAALRALGADVRVLVPAYAPLLGAHPEARIVARLEGLGGAFAPAHLLAVERAGAVPLYLVHCPGYYHRAGSAYQDERSRDWSDNHLRFGLLSRVAALLATEASPLAWRPDVLNCHDWPAGLAPAYLHFERGARALAVMTVHNLAFQGVFPAATLAALGLPPQAYHIGGVEYYGQLSFLKAGLAYADYLTTVSPGYAREIQTEEFGCGLGGLLRQRADRLAGILNGIDTETWNPATDAHLCAPYDFSCIARKALNKEALRRELGLAPDPDAPLLAMVSRLTHQKGVDLVAAIGCEIAGLPAQLAVLGTGEPALERELAGLATRHPGKIAVQIRFDEALAHRMEAGADIFLMPSRFEPCGLNQMYSLRYGTPPVVRATGGLADTVVDATPKNLAAGIATGFVFGPAQPQALLEALARAVRAWRDEDTWRALQRAGMAQDFGWERSARRYLELFRSAVRDAGRASEGPARGTF